MGLPIKQRKKFLSHKQRWDKQTIVDEKELVASYALKNKKEIRKIEFLVGKFKKLAKYYNRADEAEQAEKFLESLKAKGFLAAEATSLDDVLNITTRDVLERRLSNVVYKLKLARSPSQARQFVVHRHVRVGGKVIDSPSFLVPLALEPTVEFRDSSSLSSEEHPERKMADEGIIVEESKEFDLPQEEVDQDGKSAADRKEEALDDEEQEEKVE